MFWKFRSLVFSLFLIAVTVLDPILYEVSFTDLLAKMPIPLDTFVN